jgi:hypothetical protein
MAQGQANQAETLETLMEAWELKKILKMLSITDASIAILPRENGVRLEALSNDKIALVAIDVDWFRGLDSGLLFDVYDASRLMRSLPWSRLEVKVSIDGNWLRASAPGGEFNAKLDVIEKPEGIMDGVLKHLNEGVKAVMKVDAFKLWSWFRPFSVVGDARAHFKVLYGGLIIGALDEDAPMMLDVKGSLFNEYESDSLFEVGYYLGYIVPFLEEVRRNGNVNVMLGPNKPMLIEANLGKGARAYLAQAPMVE